MEQGTHAKILSLAVAVERFDTVAMTDLGIWF